MAPKQIHHSNHQRSPIAIGLLKKGKYANGQRLTQLIQAVASQEDPQNCTIESLDANILRIVCDCSDVGAEESNVHIKRSHHDIVLLGLFHQAQVLV